MIIAGAKSVVMSVDCTLLAEDGEYTQLTKTWAQSLMIRMGLVKRKASSKKSKMTDEFQQSKSTFFRQVGSFAKVHAILADMVINWDQMGINVVPSNFTMEERGASRVKIAGYGDKRMIKATFTATLTGEFLPMQILYGGKTNRCHPRYTFLAVFNIHHNPNHWANEECAIRFIKKIIIPYVKTTRERLSDPSQTAMVLLDVFKGQTTTAVHDLMEENNIVYEHITSGCTDKLQLSSLIGEHVSKVLFQREILNLVYMLKK